MSDLPKAVRAIGILLAIGVLVFGALGTFTVVGVDEIERAYPPSGHFVDAERGRIHLVEVGSPNAPAVVLLHGAGANLRDMRLALADSLADKYRVILVDRPGHGWSERPEGKLFASPRTQARLINQALILQKSESPALFSLAIHGPALW